MANSEQNLVDIKRKNAPPRLSGGLRTNKNIEQNQVMARRKEMSRTNFESNI